MGSSLDPSTDIGPLVSQAQRRRVEGYIAQGLAEGDRLLVGGSRPKEHEHGWFVEPTVFADVDPSHVIAREEIFGPVVTITPYADEGEAVALANDSEYGLAGTVWTTDDEHGLQVAQRLNTGNVGINHFLPDHHSPMEALGASGVGVKLGPEGLASYQHFQTIQL